MIHPRLGEEIQVIGQFQRISKHNFMVLCNQELFSSPLSLVHGILTRFILKNIGNSFHFNPSKQVEKKKHSNIFLEMSPKMINLTRIHFLTLEMRTPIENGVFNPTLICTQFPWKNISPHYGFGNIAQ